MFCSKCKEKQQIAFGENIHFIRRTAVIRALEALKWRVAPTVLCVNCRVAQEEKENGPPTGEDIVGWNA